MADRVFAKGIYFNEKHQNAPDFVIGGLAIKIDSLKDLVEQAKEYANDKGYVRYQITQGRDGKYSISVDTYGLDKSKRNTREEIDPMDLPF